MKTSRKSIVIGLCLLAGSFATGLLSMPYASAESTRGYTVTSPTSSDVWMAGTTHEITWVWTVNSGADVTIEYDWFIYTNPLTIVASTPNDGSFNWTIPSGTEPRSNYFIRISNASDPSDYDDSEFFSIISSTHDSITVTSPTSLSVWQVGNTYTITWDPQGNIGNNVRIELAWWIYTNPTTIASSTPNDGSYEWTIPDSTTSGSGYIIRIKSISHSSIYGDSARFQITPAPVNTLFVALLGIIILIVIVIIIVAVVFALKKSAPAPPPPGMAPPGTAQRYPAQQQVYQPRAPMKMCPKCRSSNVGSATFCMKCGNRL